MSEWGKIPLSRTTKFVVDNRGKTAPTDDNGIPLIATNCVNNTNLYPSHENLRYVSQETYDTWFRSHPQPGDILLTLKGSQNGAVCLVPNPVGFVIAQDMVALRIDENIIDPLFLFAALRSPDVQSQIKNLDVSGVIPHLKKSDFDKLLLPYPDPPIQKAIGEFYFTLSRKIDLLHRQNKTLEAIAETLFRQWFIEEASVNPERQILLGDLIETISITHSFYSSNVIFLNTSDIYLGNVLKHDYENVINLPGQAKKSIKRDDILFSEIRPANGRYAYIDFDADDYVVSTKLMVLRSKGILKQSFIYFFLTNSKTIEWLQVLAESRSGTFPQITFDQLQGLIVNVPSDDLIHTASQLCDGWLKKIKFNQSQIRTLEKLRDTLLPKLMSGEVRVAL